MKDGRTKINGSEHPDKSGFSRPDPETLHTTDPQESMEGPVSSTMRETGEQFDTTESKQEADQERDENL